MGWFGVLRFMRYVSRFVFVVLVMFVCCLLCRVFVKVGSCVGFIVCCCSSVIFLCMVVVRVIVIIFIVVRVVRMFVLCFVCCFVVFVVFGVSWC